MWLRINTGLIVVCNYEQVYVFTWLTRVSYGVWRVKIVASLHINLENLYLQLIVFGNKTQPLICL